MPRGLRITFASALSYAIDLGRGVFSTTGQAATLTYATAPAIVLSAVSTTGTVGTPGTATGGNSGPGTVSMTASLSNGGTVTPSGAVSVAPGASQMFALNYINAATHLLTLTNNSGGTVTGGSNGNGTSSISVSLPATPPPPPPPVPSGTMSPFTLTSATTQTAPFSIGFPIRQGDVPAASAIAVTGATAQVNIKSTWPDGSAKFAVISGTAALTAGLPLPVTPAVGTASSGTALTTAALGTAIGAVTVDAGAFGAAVFSGADWTTPFQTWTTGHRMLSCIYRKQIGADAHLVAWLEVRYFSTGAVEVLPWVENGYLTVASPTNKSDTYSFVLGGTTRFSAAVDIKHHTRIPLLTGSVFSYWLGTDPGVTFAHSTAYMMATKLVPKYGYGAPSTATLNALLQTYTPNTLAGINSSMGTAGSSAALINSPQAIYVSSGGDSRALASALVFGFSGGSWSTHYRDEATNLPHSLPTYAGITLQGGTPAIPTPGGTTNGTPVTTHQPSFGYLPYLLTGRWWFLEESQFWTSYNFLAAPVAPRRGEVAFGTGPYLFADGSAGVIDPRAGTYANRGAHWSMRTLAQTLAITPSTHANHAGYQAAVENNTSFYHAVFVTGTHAPGWVSPMGALGEYSSSQGSQISPNGSTAWWGSVWMMLFGPQVWGFASNLGLSQSTASATRMTAVRNHSYKVVVDRTTDGSGSSPNWRRFTLFKAPFGTDGTGLPPETMWTAAQGYAEYVSRWALPVLTTAMGGSLKQHQGDAGSVDSDITAGSSAASDYLPFGLSALAYAVEHRALNAFDGWRRLSSASNWTVSTDGLKESPEHGITPLLPDWMPAAGQFADISLNTLVSARPTGWPSTEPAGPFINWAGGAWAKDFGAAGGLVIHGSGHLTVGATLYAGVWVFDLATRRWVGRNVPTAPLIENSDYNIDGESTAAATLGHTYPPHTYDGLVYVPAAIAGNTSGKLVKNWWPGSPWRNSVHVFDLDSTTAPAVRVINEIAMSSGVSTYPSAAYDSNRGGYWILTANGLGPMKFVNATTWAVTNYPGIEYNVYGDQSLVYIPSLDCLVGMGRGDAANTVFKVWVCPIVANAPTGFVEVTPTGTKPADGRCGGQWSEWLGGVICYVGDGSYTVQRLSPPTSGTLTAGIWAWTSQTLTGAGGVTPSRPGLNTNNNLPYGGNGTWSRFVEVDYLPGVFIWASSLSGNTQAWYVDKNGVWT